jgi:predicted nucleic acid-binding Zn ribbon protein
MRASPVTEKEKSARPRSIADDIVDVVETATSKWTRQKKSEERHPGMVRYRASRMTKEPRTTQREAAGQILPERERQRHLACSGTPNLLSSAPEDHGDDR